MSQPDDLTVIWYTYSTIAQTLASAFGFLTAVCLYQMQAISNFLTRTANHRLRGHLENPDGTEFLYESGNFDGFRQHIDTHGPRKDIDAGGLRHYTQGLMEFDAKLRDLNCLKDGLRVSLYPTAVTILASITLLPFTNSKVFSSLLTACLPLIPVVVLTWFCVISYYHLAGALVGGEAGFERLRSFVAKTRRLGTVKDD